MIIANPALPQSPIDIPKPYLPDLIIKEIHP